MKMWKGNGKTTTLLLLFLKGLGKFNIKKEEDTIEMKHFNNILFHRSGHANKQNTYQSIKQFVPGDFVQKAYKG